MLTRWCCTLLLKQNIYFPTSVSKKDLNLLLFKQKGCSGDQGRPSFFISKEHLELFLSYGFHCPEIGQILGVSESPAKMTLMMRRKKNH